MFIYLQLIFNLKKHQLNVSCVTTEVTEMDKLLEKKKFRRQIITVYSAKKNNTTYYYSGTHWIDDLYLLIISRCVGMIVIYFRF